MDKCSSIRPALNLPVIRTKGNCNKTATRKCNGNKLQERVKNITGAWRTGKFMPLLLRPYSANCYALSKCWFISSTVNFREQDISNINSSIKKLMYGNLLLKPEEMVLHRPVSAGGLGFISIKLKSLAYLLRTFLELSVNPN